MSNQPENEDQRPDPDELLNRIQAEDSKKGRLKIFFGYAAGVGKTYAMLSDARRQLELGNNVVAGYIEPHARPDTMLLLESLHRIPPKRIEYKGISLTDFDLDAALLTPKPALVLVDELAHSNAPGLRHVKRWQDVKELLDQNIDVYTTLNVQHLESLSDMVAGITGISVAETVPDAMFDRADRIEVIDLPPEELLERFKEGKIYIPTQAETAMRNFFQKPKLVALREIALRRTAEQVNRSVQKYRLERPDLGVWPTMETLLVCVGPSVSSATVIRKARRMAAAFNARWVALNVRPAAGALDAAEQESLRNNLQLAESLGAEVAVIRAEGDPASAIVEYARLWNTTKIIIGKNLSPVRGPLRLKNDLVDRLLRSSGEIDVYVIPGESVRKSASPGPELMVGWSEFVKAALVMAGAVSLAAVLRAISFDLANIIMVLLLGVALVSMWFGRTAGIAAAILGALSFNFFFTEPLFSFAISDTQYIVTFVVMLFAALTLSTLTSRIKRQALLSRQQEWRTDALLRLSRGLSRVAGRLRIVSSAHEALSKTFRADFSVFLQEKGSLFKVVGAAFTPVDEREAAVASWVLNNGQPAGAGTATLSAADRLYLPLMGSQKTFGVLGVGFRDRTDLGFRDLRNMLDASCTQIAMALEREELSETTHAAMLSIESERLRNSLLRSISHDLRTPLTGIAGSASVLSMKHAGSLDEEDRELLDGITEESFSMVRIVDNLLSLTRLESDRIVLHKEPEAVDDVVSSAINTAGKRLADHRLTVSMPEDVLLVPMESVLIEQVLVNLLDNAAKYSEKGGTIDIVVRAEEGKAVFEVCDRGDGIPAGEEKLIFEKFYRLGRHAKRTKGSGLGLSICKAIIEAHGGGISVRPRHGGGSCFSFALPLAAEATDGK